MNEEDSVDDKAMGLFTQEDVDDGDDEPMEKKNEITFASPLAKKSESHSKVGGVIQDKENNNDDNDGNDVDADVDDDGSSVDSLSSSQSGSSLSSMASTSSEVSLTLMQRQARNIARNERFLGSLREKYKDQLGEVPSAKAKGATTKSAHGKNTGTTSDGEGNENDGDHSRDEETLGMVRKGSHRLFRFSPPTREGSTSTGGPKSSKADKEYNALLRSCQNYASGIRALEQRYPHRSAQIGKLHGILSATMSLTATTPPLMVSSSAASVYVPAPIFCMGSKGTGKTSVVCDVVGLLSSSSSSSSREETIISPSLTPATKVQPAYVDCSIVEPSTIERLVYTIYKQLKPSSSPIASDEKKKASSKGKSRHQTQSKKKRKRPVGSTSLPLSSKAPLPTNANKEDDANRPPPPPPTTEATALEAETQPRVLPSRRAKKAAIHKSLAQNATTYKTVQKSRNADEEDMDEDADEDDSDDEAIATLHSVVLSLGRSLQKHYGSHVDDNGAYRNRGFAKKPKCGILILDKAEELLSLSSASKRGTSSSSSSSGGASNYLSELLLLPKIMKLNITIVVITNYCTLHMTRLNNASDPSKALGTISNGVHPIIVQFQAYKGNKVFSEILSTPENQKLVMGDSLSSFSPPSAMRQSLKDKLVRSFWNTVVQFASDSTRDIRDFQRLGRALWPSFVAPLHPSVLKSTLTTAANKLNIGIASLTRKGLSDPSLYSKIEDEIVRQLGNKFYPRVASLASGDDSLTLLTLDEDGWIPVLPADDTSEDKNAARGKIFHNPNIGVTLSVPQPYLRNCLLLAAFICQHNKADRDRKLFSVHGNGKRRKSKAKEDIYGGNAEDLAFGSTSVTLQGGRKTKQQPHQVEQLRSLKLRPVPLERVFSIFVTLVRLNPDHGEMDEALGFGGELDDEANLEATMDDLGSSRLYTDLSHLIDLGYLHLVKGNQPLHLTPSRILCSLTREEALEISGRIGIPLERYLL